MQPHFECCFRVVLDSLVRVDSFVTPLLRLLSRLNVIEQELNRNTAEEGKRHNAHMRVQWRYQVMIIIGDM